MGQYLARDVFTPTKPARVAFVERDAVNDRLVSALTTPGKQVVVYGHSGSGKTTLLINKLNQLYENHVTTRCMRGLTFEQLILDGFDQLAPFYIAERTAASSKSISGELAGSYLNIQSKIGGTKTTETSEKEVRILPPQLTPQALGRFMGAAKCCWVLEDFHKIDEAEKVKLSQLMKVFMDLADEYGELKIVALGAVDTARQVIDCDREMRNRVAEIHVTLMTEKEIEAIISKGEAALNIVFGKEIKSLIARYSNGLASACHHLCLNMCDAAGVHCTVSSPIALAKEHFETAIKAYAEDASDSIRSAFDSAVRQRRKTRFDNATIVIKALCRSPERGASRFDLHKRIRQAEPSYPEYNLKNILPRLTTPEYGGILRYDSTSGLYSFSDPIYRAFALAQYRDATDAAWRASSDRDLSEVIRIFTNEFERLLVVSGSTSRVVFHTSRKK
ncbi:MAG: ATP-binding protein [Gammaproteobacteria bacterium]